MANKNTNLPKGNQLFLQMFDKLDLDGAKKKTLKEIEESRQMLSDPEKKVVIALSDKDKINAFGRHMFARCDEIDTPKNRATYCDITGAKLEKENASQPLRKRRRTD